MSRTSRLVAFTIACVFPSIAWAGAISTDRPTVAPTSGVMDRERFQLELGPVFGGATMPLQLGVRFGLAKGVELRASTDALTLSAASVRGPTQVAGGLKLRAQESADALLAAVLQVNYDLLRAALGWNAGLVVSLDLPNGFGSWAYLDVATKVFLSVATPAVTGSIGFSHVLLSDLDLGAFVEASFAWAAPNGAFLPSTMLGLTWLAKKDVQLDAWVMPTFTVGTRIASVAGGVGVSLRL